MEINYKAFYTQYAYDYHLYKVTTLSSILDRCEAFQEDYLAAQISGYNEADYARFLKGEIRVTCFHVIETLFELIFGLEPKEGKCRDLDLLQAISTSNFQKNYSRIERIATDESELAFLDLATAQFGNHPLWMHIFFFAPPLKEPGVPELLQDSYEAIKLFLKEAAITFSRRYEYNAYKHGTRVLNAFQEFGWSDPDGQNAVKYDLSDSMSFFTVEKQDGKAVNEVITTKMFNTKKDIKMILLANMPITNIIRRRRWVLVPEDRGGDNPGSTNFMKEAVLDMIRTHNGPAGFIIDDIITRRKI
ncbi:hypothetical protein [Dyadobacter luticola]|uniref:Uncharacterized protein n=1 Tax=Dyadobacter luticola TaxID=1979387 RepID=A0A5R9KW90_9BACT|nr:hypothetical protein [Dyadobacter luticola]TLV00359.1 hypothetical protein FEN17_12750 [Dyadobacter luticola]